MSATSLIVSEQYQIPFARSFAGHETFPLRYFWLKKGVDHVENDPKPFQQENTIVSLGVGKNMVRSIRHWCLSTKVVEEATDLPDKRLRLTELGRNLLTDTGWDPFLEDDATLWIIHWHLTSKNTRTATWYLAFNRFHEYSFTRTTMIDFLTRTLQALDWNNISYATLKRDVDCFVNTYLLRREDSSGRNDSIECPLTGLGLVFQEPEGQRLRFNYGPKDSLPSEVFAYALAEFWNLECPERLVLEFRDIVSSEGSPALIFKLDKDSVLYYLDELASITAGTMIFEDTAGDRRVVKSSVQPVDSILLLEAYYARK